MGWYYINIAFDASLSNMAQEITSSDIEKIPVHYYRPVNTRDKYRMMDPLRGGMCVCLVPYKKCERLVKFPCGHRMHKKCALLWVKFRETCPFCELENKKKDG